MQNKEEFDLVINENSEVLEPQTGDFVKKPEGRLLHIKKGQKDIDFINILAQLSQYADIGHALKHIDKVKQYVVQIPLQYQKALNEGKYFINQNKTTGVKWPSLVEVMEDGKRKIVDNLPIDEQNLIQGNPMRDISINFYNIALQKQIASIADTVEQTYKVVERNEHGQMDDRIALLYSGKKQIQLAMTMKDPDKRNLEIANGRKGLIDGMYQLGLALKRRIEGFEPIPKSRFEQWWLAFWDNGIFDQVDDEFQEIQNCYELYLKATKLLAASYVVSGEIEVAKKAFSDSIDFIKTIKFKNIRTIEFIHNREGIHDLFVYHPIEYIEAEQEDTGENSREFDYMIIEATGEELLEVLGNGNEI